MTESGPIEGKCLCGAVTVRVTPSAPHVDACHCDMCRRWGGGPLLTLQLTSEAEIEGEAHVTRFASSDWAERGFCSRCGTHLFYFYKPKAAYSFPAGLFAEAETFDFVEEIFVDEQPGYYAFAGERERLTGAEIQEKFSSGGE